MIYYLVILFYKEQDKRITMMQLAIYRCLYQSCHLDNRLTLTDPISAWGDSDTTYSSCYYFHVYTFPMIYRDRIGPDRGVRAKVLTLTKSIIVYGGGFTMFNWRFQRGLGEGQTHGTQSVQVKCMNLSF